MSGEPAVAAAALGKRFRLYRRPIDRAREWAGLGQPHAELWALRGVGFEVGAGEALGVIGRNGAGKTTLLRLLAGTLTPSEGSLAVRGRVLPLLGVGAGLRGELSGRQNAEAALDLLHLPHGGLAEGVARVEAFAELGAGFERPLATWSRGMRARLAFALLLSVDADVLLLDEAWGGADLPFRERCSARLRELHARGAAVVFATHNPELLRAHCTSALALEGGRVACRGTPAEVSREWRALVRASPRPL